MTSSASETFVKLARRSRQLGACLLACLALTSPALAEPSAAEIAVARKLFREATAHEKKDEWAAAEKKLRQAVAIKETPGLRYHLAFVQERQGKLVEALVDYDRASELVSGGQKALDVERLLEPARAAVRERVPRLTVTVQDGVTGAVLTIDGKSVANSLIGQSVPLNPGQHLIVVASKNRQDFRVELSLSEGEKRDVHADLPSAAPSPHGASDGGVMEAPTSETDDEGEPRSGFARPAVLIGESVVSAGFLGLGLAFTFKKKDAQDRVRAATRELDDMGATSSSCAPTNPTRSDSCDLLAKARQDEFDADTPILVGYVGAGVGVAATVLTALLWRPANGKSEQATLFSTPVPGGFVGGVTGRF